MNIDYAIIGGGLSGLAAARELNKKSHSFLVFEATHRLGGRTGSDYQNGFILDRGFQVFNSGYKKTHSIIKCQALSFCHYPKIVSSITQKKHTWYGLPGSCPNGFKWSEKVRIPLSDLWQMGCDMLNIRKGARSCSTRDHFLRSFSSRTRTQFLSPFFQAVSLDPLLQLSVHHYRRYLRRFFWYHSTIPRLGMQKIPDQLAQSIAPSKIKLRTSVSVIDGHAIHTASGDIFTAKHIILATPMACTFRLLNHPFSNRSCPVTTYYFSTNTFPFSSPLIFLGSTQYILHLAIPSLVSKDYSPSGKHLIMATQLSHSPQSESIIKNDLRLDLGDCVDDWTLIHQLTIPDAIYEASPLPHTPSHIHLAGNWISAPSIEGAVSSGLHIAQSL